jgi:hypothetical protein
MVGKTATVEIAANQRIQGRVIPHAPRIASPMILVE